MARQRRSAVGMESLDELARKMEVLERELALQRQALEKLKQMGTSPKVAPETAAPPVRKTA